MSTKPLNKKKDTPKRLPQEQRRQQIVLEAMKIINEEGFASFTTRRLAKNIGISEPALYRHFDGKDEIIISVILKMDELWGEVEKKLSNIAEPKEKICQFIMSHFRHIESNPDVLSVLFADEYIRLDEKIKSRVEHVVNQRFAFLDNLFTELSESKIICGKNPKAITMIVMGSIRMTILNWRNMDYSYSLTECGEDICCNLVNMIFN